LSETKKLLATGHRGFVGTALGKFLQASVEHGASWCRLDHESDVTDPRGLRDMLEQHRPDWIIHLAAKSHVQASWVDPIHTLHVNVSGTANLLKTLTEMGFQGRLLYVSSADVYGSVPDAALPVTENTVPAPRSPYASSKIAAETLCLQWARSRSLDVVIARPFNHTGPGQAPEFALPGFARDLAAIKLRRRAGPILAGDLEVTRDFLDVRDVIAAYLALLEHGRASEIYNVCSGRETRLGHAFAIMAGLAGIEAEAATDPARLRPSEQRRMCGSHAKLTAATGWQPRIELRDTLAQLMNHWMQESNT
jgi:GDP-4-dehydro-6-deoxy-D-mannose reductase